MNCIQNLVADLEREFALTRKTLESAAEEHFLWRPHYRSYSLGELSSHIANLPVWLYYVLSAPKLNVGGLDNVEPASTNQELLNRFDENVQRAMVLLTGADESFFEQPWALYHGERLVFTNTRLEVIRSSVIHHMIHHRGQLTVYLRLLNIRVPNTYWPTADDDLFT